MATEHQRLERLEHLASRVLAGIHSGNPVDLAGELQAASSIPPSDQLLVASMIQGREEFIGNPTIGGIRDLMIARAQVDLAQAHEEAAERREAEAQARHDQRHKDAQALREAVGEASGRLARVGIGLAFVGVLVGLVQAWAAFR